MFHSVHVPYFLAYGMCSCGKNTPNHQEASYRLFSIDVVVRLIGRGIGYSNQKLHERLGWKPRVPMEQAMEAFLSQFESNGNNDPLKS